MKKINVYVLMLLMALMSVTAASSCSRGYGCNNLAGEERANKKSRPSKSSRGELFDRRTRRQISGQNR